MEKALPKRAEVPEELTWRLEDICADEAAWEQQLNKALELADEIRKYVEHIREQDEQPVPVRLWMTGFSRGGAVANLTAKLIQDLDIQDAYIYNLIFTASKLSADGLKSI